MEIIDAILVGIVQGLTEFLPVSSSGHIELAQKILNADNLKEHEELLSVVLHVATALSTIVVFRKDIFQIIKGLLRFEWNDDLQLICKIALSMIPAVIIGLFFEEELKQLFEGNLMLVGSMLIVTAILLYFADKSKDTNKKVSFGNAIVIGMAQAVAILPGISRSGATISTSVLLGNDKGKAARFSFLMVLPLIFGKIAKDILDDKVVMKEDLIMPFTFGFFAAFITGLLACTWMITLVKKSKLSYFSIYCVIVGIVAIVWSFMS
jgi:undecaprenyl-diphosphatase